MTTVTKEKLNWADLVAEEPALGELERECRDAKGLAKDNPRWCANAFWFDYSQSSRGSVKERLVDLVGWHAENPKLRGHQAYDTAYEYLYGLLPDCRHDGPFC